MKKVLNVGGNVEEIPLPGYYAGWQNVRLDIDPAVQPDVLLDARDFLSHAAESFDSVLCSHNLEHFHRHEVGRVLRGFAHVLKPDGFLIVRVPDLLAVMRDVVGKALDVTDVLYDSPAGPITVLDVLYGFGREIESSGNDYFSHKTGFSEKSLRAALLDAGYTYIYTGFVLYEIVMIAFKSAPSAEYARLLKLPEIASQSG